MTKLFGTKFRIIQRGDGMCQVQKNEKLVNNSKSSRR
jgi:hypothetical protein